MINEIHYAVSIDTGTNITLTDIGMFEGKFLFVTDGYDVSPLTTTYENGDPVEDWMWNTDLLKKGGISASNQKIDIITGGDFAFIGSLDVTLINTDYIHEQIKKNPNFNIGGAKVSLFAIIDDVMYNRWDGVVIGDSLSDRTFTFKCGDKNNVENVVLNDYVFGINETELKLIVEDEEAIIKTDFVKMVESRSTSIQCQQHEETQYVEDQYFTRYTGFKFDFERLCSIDEWNLVVSGDRTNDIFTNMYLQVNGGIEPSDGIKYLIKDVKLFTFLDDDGNVSTNTILSVETLDGLIVDFNNLYGVQPSSMPKDVKDGTLIADDTTITISIFASGSVYTIPEGTELVTRNGQYVGLDDDGNEVLVDGVVTGNEFRLISTEKTTTILPKRIEAFTDSINDQLESGTLTHLEDYYGNINIPQSFGSVETASRNVEETKEMYLKLKFDEEISSSQLGLILSNNIDSVANWSIFNVPQEVGPRTTVSTLIMPGAPETPNGYDTSYNISDTGFIYSFYDGFQITVWSIITDDERGEVPFLKGESFVVPNTRKTTYAEVLDGTIWANANNPRNNNVFHTQTESMWNSNMPKEIIGNAKSVFSSYIQPNIMNVTEDNEFEYPGGKFEKLTNSEELVGDYFLIQIVPVWKDQTPLTPPPGKQTPVGQYLNSSEDKALRFSMGTTPIDYQIDTVCAFNVEEISGDIRLKTQPVGGSDLGTYDNVIRDLADSPSLLPNRTNWYVGGQITDEDEFKVVTELCKTGMVAGYTNRFGEVILKEFLNDFSVTHIIDNNIMIDKSQSNYDITDINKCYNEFTIKWHKIGNEYAREVSLTNIEQEEFPDKYSANYEWGTQIATDGDLKVPDTGTTNFFRVPVGEEWSAEFGDYIRFNTSSGYVVGTNFEKYATSGGDDFWRMYVVENSNVPPQTPWYNLTGYSLNQGETLATWKSYVTNVPDSLYSSAKILWEKARRSYLLNKRTRTAPTNRTTLKYAKELGIFDGTFGVNGIEFSTDEYGWEYLNLLVDWATVQKYQLKFEVPITTETIKYELIDRVRVYDPLILQQGEFGSGWITGVRLDTKNNRLKINVLFDKFFMSNEEEPTCGYIIEQASNTDYIIEDKDNVDYINEGECNQ